MKIIIGILLISGFVFLSNQDYEDEVAEQKVYCERVLAGDWLDYKRVTDECGK